MVSSWLCKASTLAICAMAVSRAGATPAPSVPAEEIKLDALGQMHWDTDREKKPSSIGRPNFDRLDVEAIEKSMDDETQRWLSEAVSFGKQASEEVSDKVHDLLQGIEKTVEGIKEDFEEVKYADLFSHQDWLHKGLVWIDGLQYEKLVHPHFPNYALRLSTSGDPTSCDPDVKSFTGYLDIDDDKHLWFAFFESRSRKASSNPDKEPVVMWLNGGPGCSSSTGWLMEGVGPCTIDKNGTATKYNEHSWTNKASVFFLDQPVNVGFSYSDSGDVNNTPQGADDVYAFLSLFFAKFPEYAQSPFSIAAESYGGRYAPLYAAKIFKENKKIARSRFANDNGLAPKQINLSTIMIGNGLTDPRIQFPAVYDYACQSKYALWKEDSPECVKMQQKAKTCSGLIDNCYKYDSRLTCTSAALYCWSGMYSDMQNTGRNLYDIRKPCDRDPSADGPLCYRDETYVEHYMNLPEVKKAYGIPDKISFEACDGSVNRAFLLQGDSMHNSAAVLPEMIEDGVRLLIYAGQYDAMCNFIGNEQWFLDLQSPYTTEVQKAKEVPWVVNGKKAGSVIKAGRGAGNVAFVKVANAGHMVPYDQPVASQRMVEAWLSNKSIA